MIPQEYLLPWLVSNVIALALLVIAFVRADWVRWASILIFAWATFTNARIGLTAPAEYQAFGELTVLPLYRDFIHGWFREHTALFLLPIAAGQLTIASLLLWNTAAARRLAVVGAIVFLLAIAPLGVGSAFPFSLSYSAALWVMDHRMRRIAARRSTS